MNFDQEIIPYLRKKYGDTLTIWSAACSTGDEPYTIAMILSEYIPLSKIRIIATDLDEDVLAFAKEGVYPAKSLSDLPKKYLDKHFKKVDDSHYAISPEIKKCVEFKKHNLLKDRYFQHIHMIVCRNVVIYFTDEAKDQVYENFHGALVDVESCLLAARNRSCMQKNWDLSRCVHFIKIVKYKLARSNYPMI